MYAALHAGRCIPKSLRVASVSYLPAGKLEACTYEFKLFGVAAALRFLAYSELGEGKGWGGALP